MPRTPNHLATLSRAADAIEARLIVVDSLRGFGGHDENDSGEVRGLADGLRILCDGRRLVIGIHHLAKGKMAGGKTVRGSTDFPASFDASATLERRGGHVRLRVRHHDVPEAECGLEIAFSGDGSVRVTAAAATAGAPAEELVLKAIRSGSTSKRSIRSAAKGVSHEAQDRALDSLEKRGLIRNIGAGPKQHWTSVEAGQ